MKNEINAVLENMTTTAPEPEDYTGEVSVIFKIISSNPFVISSRTPYRYNRVCPFSGLSWLRPPAPT